MKYLTNDSTDPHYNMAFDEFCLEHLPLDEPVFYLWQNSPSVIIGLNQNAYGEVNLPYIEAHGIKLARRVTGGGAVYHDLQNLNYTIVGKSADLDRDYPGYMHIVIDALRELGVEAEMSGRNDILVGGRKVSGYAKRVWKDRLMIHGTLMYDVDIKTLTEALTVPGSKMETSGITSVRSRVTNLKDELPWCKSIHELKASLLSIMSGSDGEYPISDAQRLEIEKISKEKFALDSWNLGRSPLTTFHKKEKFPCGTVEADFSVTRGVITALAFGGDFIGNIAPDPVSQGLIGCAYEHDAVLAALETLPLASCFDALSAEEMADLLTSVGS